ncbi:F-box protein SKIP27-like isoform X2 [Capsicum annuum]|uniref:F-box protein SKIP27-like isoform X2 n=1 Tax=Capsicum annuum TaxID=4072 RepID=UPI001FB081CB|nr:F-box protein SKIP27-like isoform X2 [Capsicum annuum]
MGNSTTAGVMVELFLVKKKKMALGTNCEDLGLGIVRSTSFGRKRVTLSNTVDVDFISTTPTKKFCSQNSCSTNEKSVLEALPKDILIKIVCGVDHDDLKRLFHVSRALREASLMAKGWHFDFSTPRKTLPLRNALDVEELGDTNELEAAPNGPMQSRVARSRLSRKKLADISVALFASDS